MCGGSLRTLSLFHKDMRFLFQAPHEMNVCFGCSRMSHRDFSVSATPLSVAPDFAIKNSSGQSGEIGLTAIPWNTNHDKNTYIYIYIYERTPLRRTLVEQTTELSQEFGTYENSHLIYIYVYIYIYMFVFVSPKEAILRSTQSESLHRNPASFLALSLAMTPSALASLGVFPFLRATASAP